MELSIIFVNWNSVDYLRDCIASIYKYTTDISFEIIIIDNASPAGDAEVLENQFSNITLIKSTENLGFAGANNLGFTKSSGKYILFLNPDTKLISPAINIMLACIRSLPDAGILGCKLLNADLSTQTSCIMKFPTIMNEAFQTEYFRRRWPTRWGIAPLFSGRPQPAKVEVVSGACMLMRRETFETVGMFSDDYFMYAEDIDLCYKTTLANYTNYYTGTASVIHFAGASSAPEWQVVMKMKAVVQFCVKFRGYYYGLAFRTVLGLSAMARIIAISLLYCVRGGSSRHSLRSALGKWGTIVKTLLTTRGAKSVLVPIPKIVSS
jgi:GT2 family glycosyltransferase